MTSQTVQMYIRVFLYNLFAALASYGITTPDNTKTLIVSVAGLMGNLAWTMYGTRLNGLLEQAKERAGVVAIDVKTDPEILKPVDVNMGTSAGITATPIKPTL